MRQLQFLTKNTPYNAGDIAVFDDLTANRYVMAGIAIYVDEEAQVQEEEVQVQEEEEQEKDMEDKATTKPKKGKTKKKG